VNAAGKQISTSYPEELLTQIFSWARANDCSNPEAVRQLVMLGLSIAPIDSAVIGARIQALNEARNWVMNEIRIKFEEMGKTINASKGGS
jgi:hypothetical protein